jgi:hypothetical protein
MNTLRLALMIIAVTAAAASARGLADGKPSRPGAQDKSRRELEKELHDKFVAECQADERRYKDMVKANPRDTKAWLLLGWNAASNLAVAFPDVTERYDHVKRGLGYLVEGVGHNPNDLELYANVGWHLHHSVGRNADRPAFRNFFRNDKDLHKMLAGRVELKDVTGPDGLPDNYLVAQRWYEKAVSLVGKQELPADGAEFMSPVVLNSLPAICRRTYARAIEDEGHFGEAAVNAWKQALTMWDALGEREFTAKDGTKYRLKDNETALAQVNYPYWKRRCQAEPTELVLAARRAVYQVDQHWAKHRENWTDEARGQAKDLFDQAFRAWADVSKKHAWLLEDDAELEEFIRQYQRRVLNGQPLPDDFPLRHIPSILPGRR